MYTFENKVAIVTGGANGIGAEIVKEFLKEGLKYVAIIDIVEHSGTTLEKELRQQYGNKTVQFFQIDVTNHELMSAVFQKIIEEFGAIDVIVNNAGIACDTNTMFQKEIEINFTALVASTLKGLDLMRKDKEGRGGTIINISSIAALSLVSPSIFVYAATKSAVLHFSNCLGMEEYFCFTGVRVLTVCFGPTKTDITLDVKGIDNITTECLKSLLENLTKQNLIQTPTAAAQGVVQIFKCGDTGSTWIVDKGVTTDITSDVKQAYTIMSRKITLNTVDMQKNHA